MGSHISTTLHIQRGSTGSGNTSQLAGHWPVLDPFSAMAVHAINYRLLRVEVWVVCGWGKWCVGGVWMVCGWCVSGVWVVCECCVGGVWVVCG